MLRLACAEPYHPCRGALCCCQQAPRNPSRALCLQHPGVLPGLHRSGAFIQELCQASPSAACCPTLQVNQHVGRQDLSDRGFRYGFHRRPWMQMRLSCQYTGWTPAQRAWWCWAALQPLSAPSTSCSWTAACRSIIERSPCAHHQQVWPAPVHSSLLRQVEAMVSQCLNCSARLALATSCCGELRCCSVLAQGRWCIM